MQYFHNSTTGNTMVSHISLHGSRINALFVVPPSTKPNKRVTRPELITWAPNVSVRFYLGRLPSTLYGLEEKLDTSDADVLQSCHNRISSYLENVPGLSMWMVDHQWIWASQSDALTYPNPLVINHLYGGKLTISAHEQVEEFSSSIESLQIFITTITKLKNISIPFVLMKDIQLSLDTYESRLRQLSESGLLTRFMTSHRLRRELEILNALIVRKIARMDEWVDTQGKNREINPSPWWVPMIFVDKKFPISSHSTQKCEYHFFWWNSKHQTTVFTKKRVIVFWFWSTIFHWQYLVEVITMLL